MNETNLLTQRLLTPAQACRALGISRQTLKKWVKAGLIEAVPLPSGGWRIPESEIQRVLAGRESFKARISGQVPPDVVLIEYVNGHKRYLYAPLTIESLIKQLGEPELPSLGYRKVLTAYSPDNKEHFVEVWVREGVQVEAKG